MTGVAQGVVGVPARMTQRPPLGVPADVELHGPQYGRCAAPDQRLERLCAEGLLERRVYQQRPPRYEYVLTEKGTALGARSTTACAVLAAGCGWSSQRFKDRHGRRQSATLQGLRNDYRVGEEVKVVYDRDDPKRADFADPCEGGSQRCPRTWRNYFLLIGFAALPGIVFLIASFRRFLGDATRANREISATRRHEAGFARHRLCDPQRRRR